MGALEQEGKIFANQMENIWKQWADKIHHVSIQFGPSIVVGPFSQSKGHIEECSEMHLTNSHPLNSNAIFF